jgi:hypothetical protein
VKEYYIKGDSVHSDHLAVWCHLTLSAEPPRKSSYKMNVHFLKNEEVKHNLEMLWSTHADLNFYGRMRRCLKFYKEFCLQKVRERRLVESELRRRFNEALAALQVDPLNSDL